ncbi:MAG TPA: HTTM domain-containing protein [Thermomicrobiales bacterium]|nr:HTTM domain-containing protein [Thermomicrobiales bacterium]
MSSRQTSAVGPLDHTDERALSGASLADRARAAFNTLVARLFAPVDNSSIVVFRIAFGLVMLWEVNRYLSYGWVADYYIDPPYNFPYIGFEWIKPWPGNWMYVHFYALALLAGFIALGLFYRVSTTLFFLGFTYVFMLEKGHYLNHLYLACLISFLMIFVPANRSFSLDAWRRPELRSTTAPTWALVLLVAQFSIIYVYGGIAKINPDWLRGEPMRMWMANETDLPLLGRWFTEEWMVYALTYGGLLLDLFIVPIILWPRTRWLGVVALVLFHRMNAEIFTIGIFPTFATAAIILFLPPSLPRRIVSHFQHGYQKRRGSKRKQKGLEAVGDEVVPFMKRPILQRAIVVFVLGYIAVQLLLPFRQHLYPGPTAWSDYGDRFAWRMMLNSKIGTATYTITDPTSGETWTVEPDDYLTSGQIGNLMAHPEMHLQFSHYLADEWAKKGYDSVEVRVDTAISLNGREPMPIVDPTVDLAAEDYRIGPYDWITSFDEQLEVVEARQHEDAGS